MNQRGNHSNYDIQNLLGQVQEQQDEIDILKKHVESLVLRIEYLETASLSYQPPSGIIPMYSGRVQQYPGGNQPSQHQAPQASQYQAQQQRRQNYCRTHQRQNVHPGQFFCNNHSAQQPSLYRHQSLPNLHPTQRTLHSSLPNLYAPATTTTVIPPVTARKSIVTAAPTTHSQLQYTYLTPSTKTAFNSTLPTHITVPVHHPLVPVLPSIPILASVPQHIQPQQSTGSGMGKTNLGQIAPQQEQAFPQTAVNQAKENQPLPSRSPTTASSQQSQQQQE